MTTGDPDQSYLPRPELHDESLLAEAESFAATLQHEDTLRALTELHGLSPDKKGEVIRLGLSQLRAQKLARQDIGNADHILHEAEFLTRRRRQLRAMGRSALSPSVYRAS